MNYDGLDLVCVWWGEGQYRALLSARSARSARPVEKDRDVAKTLQRPDLVFESGFNSGSDYGLSFQAYSTGSLPPLHIPPQRPQLRCAHRSWAQRRPGCASQCKFGSRDTRHQVSLKDRQHKVRRCRGKPISRPLSCGTWWYNAVATDPLLESHIH